MDRRTTFGQIAGAAAVLATVPAMASADGAVSGSTRLKAKSIYGNRIALLKDAVDKGDFAAIVEEKNAFILFNSGVFPSAKDKVAKKAAIEDVNAIFAGVRKADKGATKVAYDAFVKKNGIKSFKDMKAGSGQSYSGDFAYVVNTDAASVYVR